MQKIYYTKTDEAPALATRSLLPILDKVFNSYGLTIELKDISLAGRILAQFGLKDDDLEILGDLVKQKDTFLVKLPNISASIPQLKDAILELQKQRFDIPDFVVSEKDNSVKKKYSKVLGSAVNPVLREGNSIRYIPKIIKDHAKENPHLIGQWSENSKTHVSHMQKGDFYGNEKSIEALKNETLQLVFNNKEIKTIEVEKGDIIDLTFMDIKKLREFFSFQIQSIENNVLLSIHLKATMMKISDPIIFGEFVKTYLNAVIDTNESKFSKINFANGLSEFKKKENKDLLGIIESHLKKSPSLVSAGRGNTCIESPNSLIIDSSMAFLIKDSGKMTDTQGTPLDVKCIIPDRSYVELYKQTIDFCKKNKGFDPTTMGSVSNIGLMAMKAEEYGSHDKTFQADTDGVAKIVDEKQNVLLQCTISSGDIVRSCVTKNVAILDWIKLIRESKEKTIVWLEDNRLHDTILRNKLKGENFEVLNIQDATSKTLDMIHRGQNVVSATGNVLRDYITDLFPILEAGTSSKMLSTVPLLSGGKIYETGAGGSAPKHVAQFLEENHLRWNSLGEFLAISELVSDLALQNKNLTELAVAIEKANSKLVKENKFPKRNVKELDIRGGHFYWTLYLFENLKFHETYQALLQHEKQIIDELLQVQGVSVDIGGYYNPDNTKASNAMRPCETFNDIILSLRSS